MWNFFFIFPQLKVEPKHQQLLGKIADLESEKVAAESKIRQLQLQMSNEADEVSMGGGGDVREHARLPHSFLPENLESTNLETLFLECFMRCFFRKVNFIHKGLFCQLNHSLSNNNLLQTYRRGKLVPCLTSFASYCPN